MRHCGQGGVNQRSVSKAFRDTPPPPVPEPVYSRPKKHLAHFPRLKFDWFRRYLRCTWLPARIRSLLMTVLAMRLSG
jgi:hypothetical protein